MMLNQYSSARPVLADSSDLEPIAIVGMACRYPGQADTPQAFWKFLCEGRDGIREITPDRWSLRALYDPERGRSGKTYTRHAGLIDALDQFEPQFFGIAPREAQAMDPQQRLLLETAWEAMEDAGILPEHLAASSAGVFVGISTHDYGDLMSAFTERKAGNNPYLALGSALCIAANRISYFFDLRGPSFAVDTACSSSLVALHLACASIRGGESCLAFVGGSNAVLKPEMTLGFSNAGMLSPQGRCRSFDARADGYVRAEGAGMLVLKPLSAARRDGNRIYAVVLASAINQDGQTPGISVPSGQAQADLLRQTCALAGVQPRDIQFVEAHGTGTPVGDPIEAQALGSVLGQDRPAATPCLVGSVKSNIGHLEAGAGVAGVMKAALAVFHGMIPPNLHFETPNPQIDMPALGLRVPTHLEPWPETHGLPRLAGVNSFGFGGTNAHALLAQAPSETIAAQGNGILATPCQGVTFLPLSAHSRESLHASARRYRAFLADETAGSTSLADIAWTASRHRRHHPHRLALVGGSRASFVGQIDSFLAGERAAGVAVGHKVTSARPGLAFVFTGMGPQWWAMGQQLLHEEPAFREAVRDCDRFLRTYLHESILEEMSSPEDRSRVHDDRFAQMGIFVLQVGLAALWRSWGIRPDAIVGHSVGEVAAACVSGALSLEDAVLVCYHRSRLQHLARGHGRMLAVGLPFEEARRLLIPYHGQLAIAAVNSPQSATLSGDADALAEIHDELTVEGTFSRFLQVDIPYHSPKMDVLREELFDVLATLRPKAPSLPLFSTALGKLLDEPAMDAAYWWKNIREPVQFAGAIDNLLRSGNSIFLEIGPHPVLATSIQECALAMDHQATVLASLRRTEPERATMLSALGVLYGNGFDIDWAGLHPRGGHVVSLPTYAWQRERCWRESDTGRQLRTGEADWTAQGHFGTSIHPLLGHALVTAHAEPAWDNELDLQRDHAWLADHRVQGAVVYPAAAHIEMALAAAQQCFGPEFTVLENLELDRPLFLSAGVPQPLQLLIDRLRRSFTLHSRQGDGAWLRCSWGRFERLPADRAPGGLDLDEVRARCSRSIDKTTCYEMFGKIGLEYGNNFAGIEELHTGIGEALSRIVVPDAMSLRLGEYLVLPTVLDAGFQTLLGTMAGARSKLYLPARLRRMRVLRRLDQAQGSTRVFWAHARLRHQDDSSLVGNLTIADERGNVLLEVEGLRCRALPGRPEDELPLEECLHQEVWLLQPANGKAVPDTASWRLPDPCELAHCKGDNRNFVGWVESARPTNGCGGSRKLDPPYSDQHQQSHNDGARERLSRLGLAYFFEACCQLGWDMRSGEVASLDHLVQRLGIALAQEPLFRRLVGWLESEGILRPCEGGLQVQRLPQVHSAVELWRECLVRCPAYLARLSILRSLGPKLAQILRGEVDLRALMGAAGAQTRIDLFRSDPIFRAGNDLARPALRDIVERLPAERPLRVLEIAAGEGGLTACLLPVMPALRSHYVFTDPDEEKVAAARERFAACPFLECRTLDGAQDPLPQGFAADSFDLLVCGHGAQELADPSGVEQLLAPGGLLLWIEPKVEFALMVLGPLGRPTSPMSDKLRRSGFDPVCIGESADQVLYLARRREAASNGHRELLTKRPDEVATHGNWLVLADGTGRAEQLAAAMKEMGAHVTLAWQADHFERLEPNRYRIRPASAEDLERVLLEGNDGSSWTGVVFLWGLDLPSIEQNDVQELLNRQADVCASVVELTRLAVDPYLGPAPRLWIVTQGTQPAGSAPISGLGQGVLWGLGRVLANEHPQLRCTLLDLGHDPGTDEIEALAHDLCADGNEPEIALRGQDRYVHRLAPLSLQRSVHTRDEAGTEAVVVPYRLEASRSGLVDELRLQSFSRVRPGPGQVEIEVHAAPLNFKDVAKAMHLLGEGSLEGTYSQSQLGLECAGRVVAVGEGVAGLAAGDAVVGLAAGSFASHVIAQAGAVVRKPAHLSFEEAATLPVVFLTAHYGLQHLARLQAGERVLIHAACGGVGLAAIQIAQRLGAEIYATAGSNEKRDLLRSLGIRYVMDSRTLDFAGEVMKLTDGEGVDVVLNSLGGQALVQSLSLLRECGRFIELGKRDLEFDTRIGMRPFLKQLSFFAVDLDRLVASRPELCTKLFREVMQLVEERRITPLPYTVYPVGAVREAFRTMQKARHIGKLVVSMCAAHAPVLVPPLQEPARFREDGTYLITGGLGGFGLATARWLVDHGARHLLLLGRKGATSSLAQEAVAVLQQGGARVEVRNADVSSADDLSRVLAEARRTLPPLRGVFHAAMVLDDAALLDSDRDCFLRVFSPKIAGAWNLHVQTLQDSLEHFVLYSSCAVLVGNPGQANYVAANMFLDLLAEQRRALGLPALALDWGAVRDVGVVAQRAALAQHLERLGLVPVPAGPMLDAMGALLRENVARSSVLRADWSRIRRNFPALADSPRLRLLQSSVVKDTGEAGQKENGSVQQMLRDTAAPERKERLQIMVTEVVARVLGTSPSRLDPSQPMTKIGMDSLMAVELTTRVKKELQIDVPTMTLMRGPSIAELTTSLLDLLLPKESEESGSANGTVPNMASRKSTSEASTSEETDYQEETSVTRGAD